MAGRFTLSYRIGLSDRTRLMVFSIAILLVVSLSVMVVTRYHFELALRSGNEHGGLAPREVTSSIEPGTSFAAAQLPADERARSTLLALVGNPGPGHCRRHAPGARLQSVYSSAGRKRRADSGHRLHRGRRHHHDRPAGHDQLVQSGGRADVSNDPETACCRPAHRRIDRSALARRLSPAEQLGGDQPAHSSNQGATGRRGNGVQFPLEFSLARVPLGERSIFTVIVRDTTEREAAGQLMRTQMFKLQEVKEILEAKAAELAETNRELDDFTYIASHDLKEPLRGISAYCQILLEDYGERLDADGQRRLQALVGLCQRLGRLIDDLLTYSQIRRTAVRPEVWPISTKSWPTCWRPSARPSMIDARWCASKACCQDSRPTRSGWAKCFAT